MGERRGMKALELWCKRVTDGYQGVKVENMTTSWRDGLAFCAIIHHFRPDLIDFGSLNKDEIHRNNELAFRTAELHLGIPALLDAEDMVECCVPDRLSILTYLSQFYQTFAGSRQSMSPSPNRTPPVGKRPASPSVLSPVSQSTPSKVMALGTGRREPCTKCGMPVFIAERLLVGGRRLFHRTCFRCARCQNQLSLANCYETEDGQHCCEACPDEVDVKTSDSLTSSHVDISDGYSADLDAVLERVPADHDPSERSDSVVEIKQSVQSTRAMSDFMVGQLQCEEEDVSQSLPLIVKSELAGDANVTCTVDSDRSSHVNSTSVSVDVSNSDINNSLDNLARDKSAYFFTKTNSSMAEVADKVVEDVPRIESSIKCSDKEDEPLTANDLLEDCDYDQNKLITKCTKESDDTPPSSIVKMRMRMFDTRQREEKTPKIKYSSRTSIVLSCKPGESLDTNRPSTIEPEGIITPMSKPVSDIIKSLLDGDASISPEEKEDLDKLEMPKEDDVIILTTTPDERRHSSKEVLENDDTIKENVPECDKDDIKSQVPNIECNTKTNEEKVLNYDSVVAKLDEITVPAMCLDDANKLDCAITADLPAVPSVGPEADIDAALAEETLRKESLGKDASIVYPTDLNPFGDEEESESDTGKQRAESTNPFGSSDNEDEPVEARRKPPRPPQPVSRQSVKTSAEMSTASVNPFWSDGEEPSSEEDATPRRVPVPRPRTVLNVSTPEPTPKARLRSSAGKFGSANSLSSTESTMHRKKKHAPPPPLPTSAPPLLEPPVSPAPSASSSPGTLARHRKARPAPPPPASPAGPRRELKLIPVSPAIECEKFEKDETNRTRQASSDEQQTPFMMAANKSMYGQWKRKKGPAPPRPVPQRREIRAIPMKEVKRELDDIDVQQLGLERQGVTLEKMIRSRFEEATPAEGVSPTGVAPDVEDLVLQLFEIVNEKNELFRRQAELMYLRRQHRLEEEHADLEYQIRCLLAQPDHAKTDSQKAYEEGLIRRLVDVVQRRDEIVNCLEMDRQREAEEDRSIHHQLAVFAAKGKDGGINVEAGGTITHKKNTLKMLKKKVKKSKEKLIKKKELNNVDADKDIDESDPTGKQTKDKKSKHKWF